MLVILFDVVVIIIFLPLYFDIAFVGFENIFIFCSQPYKNARKNLVRDQIQSVPYARGAERNYQVTYFFNYGRVELEQAE